MENIKIATDLLKISKQINSKTENLQQIKNIMPEMQEKLRDYIEKKEEIQRKMSETYHEAVRNVNKKTRELINDIENSLTEHLNNTSYGVKKTDNDGNRLEIFIGNNDGKKRDKSKIFIHIDLTRDDEKFLYKFINENKEIEGQLSETGTISQLLEEVKEVEMRGFWR